MLKVNDFYVGEFNGYIGVNCVVLWKLFCGYWVDEFCGVYYNFVCEML